MDYLEARVMIDNYSIMRKGAKITIMDHEDLIIFYIRLSKLTIALPST